MFNKLNIYVLWKFSDPEHRLLKGWWRINRRKIQVNNVKYQKLGIQIIADTTSDIQSQGECKLSRCLGPPWIPLRKAV